MVLMARNDDDCTRGGVEFLGLCSIERARYRAWIDTHMAECPLPKQGLGFGTMAPFAIVLREGAICYSAKVVCDCGAEQELSHIEHI